MDLGRLGKFSGKASVNTGSVSPTGRFPGTIVRMASTCARVLAAATASSRRRVKNKDGRYFMVMCASLGL
jgi:hypothetical protein